MKRVSHLPAVGENIQLFSAGFLDESGHILVAPPDGPPAQPNGADSSIIQNIWSTGEVIQARSAGCLCKPIPLYGTGRPVEWVNAFILGYLGRRSDTLYTIPILDHRCILPDGAEVAA